MKPNEFKRLVDKFYVGETTEQEEQLIKDLLEKEEYASKFDDVRSHFMIMMETEDEAVLNDTFDHRIMDQISNQEKPIEKRKLWGFSLSAVAAAALLFFSIWLIPDLFQPKSVYGTITDPVIAFNETQKIFDTISLKMNKGIVPVKKSVKELDKSLSKTAKVKEISKTMNKMKKLEELNRASELFKSFNKVSVNYGNS